MASDVVATRAVCGRLVYVCAVHAFRAPEGGLQAHYRCSRFCGRRPRSSQIGAWVSEQSAVIDSRAALDEAAELLRRRYSDQGKPVPRPPHWIGYRLVRVPRRLPDIDQI